MYILIFSLLALANDPSSTEQMIARTESKAVSTLVSIIKKQKTFQPDLYHRLSELYIRRSQSARFFEFEGMSFLPEELKSANSRKLLQTAVQIQNRILRESPDFEQTDIVLAQSAFAEQRLGRTVLALKKFEKLIVKYPKSSLFDASLLAAGEIYFEKGKFRKALGFYAKIRQESKMSPYAIYKSAWAYYNLGDSAAAIENLDLLLLRTDSKFALRDESIRDLVLFFSDKGQAGDAFEFFSSRLKKDELGRSLSHLAKLYERHGKMQKASMILSTFLSEKGPSQDILLSLVQLERKLKKYDRSFHHLESLNRLCHSGKGLENCTEVTVSELKKILTVWKRKKETQKIEQTFRWLLSHDTKEPADIYAAFADFLITQNRPFEAATMSLSASDLYGGKENLYSNSIHLFIKSFEGSWSPQKRHFILNHVKSFHARFPNSKKTVELTYLSAHLFYEAKDYPQAILTISPLAQSQNPFRVRAEDMILDIWNQKKDYDKLTLSAEQFLKSASPKRATYLKRILGESRFAALSSPSPVTMSGRPGIANKTSNGNPSNADMDTTNRVEKLLNYARGDNPIKLRRAAFAKAIENVERAKNSEKIADLYFQHSQIFPNSSESENFLKEAVFHYENAGNLKKSALVLERLIQINGRNVQYSLALGELYSTLGKKSAAIKAFTPHATSPSVAMKLFEISGRADDLQPAANSQEEPFRTQALLELAQRSYTRKDYKAAFQLSRKALGGKGPRELKAEARYIQALILSNEFNRQSLKTRQSRFEMVLALKAEKFDKAQRALLSTAEMGSPRQKLEAFSNLISLYEVFVHALQNFPRPTDMDEVHFQTLRKDLAAMSQQIEEQRIQFAKDHQILRKKYPFYDLTTSAQTPPPELMSQEDII